MFNRPRIFFGTTTRSSTKRWSPARASSLPPLPPLPIILFHAEGRVAVFMMVSRCLERSCTDRRMEAKGVTPIPAPTTIKVSKPQTFWAGAPKGPVTCKTTASGGSVPGWTRLTIVSPDWAGLSSLPEMFRPKSLGPSSVPSDASDTCDTLGVLKTTGLLDSVHLLYSINIGALGGLASFKSTPAAWAGASCVRRFRKAEHQSRVFGARMWTLMQFSSGAEVSVKGCHSPFQPSRMYWPAWYANPWGSSKVSPMTSLGKSFTLLRCK